MASSDSTEIDLAALRDAAKQIEGLITDSSMTIFETAADTSTLEAGKLDAAQWLEAVVADRGAGLRQHALDLQASFVALGERLRSIADTFEQQDQANADSLQGKAIDEIEAWTGSVGALTIPPAEGEETYDSGDNTNRDGARLGFEVDPMTGEAKKAEDGTVSVTLPAPEDLNVTVFPDTSITPDVVFADTEVLDFDYEGGFFTDGKNNDSVPQNTSFTTDITPEDDEK
ncbi:hypothetical protein AB0J90_25080 [Micromonospora sp. NPDC049523]|uniref:hypothetical protein n=1 Tax=Micromonospora sp. NPDC049523 TaxID=3155921 RepID=UPI003425666A